MLVPINENNAGKRFHESATSAIPYKRLTEFVAL